MKDPRPRRTLAELLDGIDEAREYSSPELAAIFGFARSTMEERLNRIDEETHGGFWHCIGGQKRTWGYKVKRAFNLVPPDDFAQRLQLAEERIEDHEARLRALERPSGVVKAGARAVRRRTG